MTKTRTKPNRPRPSAAADKLPAAMDLEWRTHDIPIAGDAADRLTQDWLLTNGAGGFAMGTPAGVNTRRYHGLLVAASHPPVGRVVAVNQMFEQLLVTDGDGDGKALEFSASMFPKNGEDVFAPAGHELLTRFEKGLSVAWTYRAGDVEFVRELFLHWQQQAITLRYAVCGLTNPATLRLSPMVTLRDFHSLLHKDAAGSFSVDQRADGVTVKRGEHAVTFACQQAERFERSGDWWYNLVYRGDTERGQEDSEDVYTPGAFEVKLDGDGDHLVLLTASLGHKPADVAHGINRDRADHLTPIFTHITAGKASQQKKSVELFEGLDLSAAKRALTIAADDFVVARTIKGESLSTIMAGYPWFADWGRDTFIALTGLLLETGRHAEARATLHAFAQSIRNGLVPNRFDDYDDNAAHYNTVDGSLWFIHAALRYLESTDDRDSWNEWLADACTSIMEAYIKGTDFGIRMAGDCLIEAGSPDTQLTWMDAATGGKVFTPRHGKAVEINALWYAALMGLAKVLDGERKSNANHYKKLAARTKRAFAKTFWNDEHDCLIDHVWTGDDGAEHRDESIRPNQVFVAALPDSPIPQTKQKQVLKVVTAKLLTPRGLRTLPPDDRSYHGKYTGDQYHRDEAYHQGTVWGWLIGPYTEAVLRTGKFSDTAKREAAAAIRPLLDEMMDEGLGQLHEIYEADEPHRPVGCPAQAWSIAEVLRVMRMIETK